LIEMQAISLLDVDPQQLWCGGVGSAIAQLSHAELYSRLFRS
ncbi:MAG: urease accessory protein UreF, partial [Cyanobacteriota bacterium]|nr:urease accessory protein UreF [Cyanobacteriota bacterium]